MMIARKGLLVKGGLFDKNLHAWRGSFHNLTFFAAVRTIVAACLDNLPAVRAAVHPYLAKHAYQHDEPARRTDAACRQPFAIALQPFPGNEAQIHHERNKCNRLHPINCLFMKAHLFPRFILPVCGRNWRFSAFEPLVPQNCAVQQLIAFFDFFTAVRAVFAARHDALPAVRAAVQQNLADDANRRDDKENDSKVSLHRHLVIAVQQLHDANDSVQHKADAASVHCPIDCLFHENAPTFRFIISCAG